jgi:DNA polymerase IIIc chi subunit
LDTDGRNVARALWQRCGGKFVPHNFRAHRFKAALMQNGYTEPA